MQFQSIFGVLGTVHQLILPPLALMEHKYMSYTRDNIFSTEKLEYELSYIKALVFELVVVQLRHLFCSCSADPRNYGVRWMSFQGGIRTLQALQ